MDRLGIDAAVLSVSSPCWECTSLAGMSMMLGVDDPAAIIAQLRRLHYDLAGSANAATAGRLFPRLAR